MQEDSKNLLVSGPWLEFSFGSGTPSVDEVKNGKHGMSQEHSWSRIAHHFFDLASDVRFEAMNGAIEARWLFISKETTRNTLLCVIYELLAV